MKFSNLVTAAALAASVEAQRPNFGNFGNFASFSMPSFSVPTQYASYASAFAGYGASSSSSKSSSSSIASGVTKTVSATAYGSAKTVVPVVPTASASSTAAASASAAASSISSSSNSTTSSVNSTIVSTSLDAKNNPSLPNSATHRGNWASGYDINTDIETTWPNTGNTVSATLTITNGTCSPQGDSKLCFLINGQYPGPAITANWGDYLEITVVNKLQNNGTSMHWHGFRQYNSNAQDGVGGVTDCALAPGDSKTYKFQATSHGTAWYHSHFSGQYGEGVFGPIIINGPTSANYDIDLGTVMISDYYPLTGFQTGYLAARLGPQTATNYLLNGMNAKVDGSAGTRAKFTFTAGKKHKMRLINTSTDHHFKVQIDGHKLWVVAADLVAIQPYMVSELSINVGQRYDVIVVADQTASNYWFRAMLASDCSFGANAGTGTANGVISYSGAASALPTTKASTHSDACVDESLGALVPVVAKSVDSGSFASSVVTETLGANVLTSNNDTVFQWTIGGISQVIDWSSPTLQSAANGLTTFDASRHVVTLPNANQWVYFVLYNAFFMPHPMHLHGHDFAILGAGSGSFSAASNMGQLNFKNPPRRDVVTLTARGWTVIAFQTDNPGAWLMHCHISWHAGGGLSLMFLERPTEIPGLYANTVTSSAFTNTCSNWAKYAPSMVYKQSDSGLKRRELIDGIEMEVLEDLPERRREEAAVKAHMNQHVRRHARSMI